MESKEIFDTIVIGGSYAGLSAAMALGRSLRRALIIDSGTPCNRQTPHSHNFLTQDGKTPAEIAATAREQVAKYETVHFLSGMATDVKEIGGQFEVRIKDQDIRLAKKLIIATGVRDMMPDMPGFADCWGITVIHCPYCHGYEFRGKPTGILIPQDPAQAVHLSGLVRNLTEDLTLFTNGTQPFDDMQLQQFAGKGIRLVNDSIREIDHRDGLIQYIVLENGERIALSALYARVPFDLYHDIGEQLGCQKTDFGLLQVDAFQKTNVPGVYACGDNASPMRSVANAVYTGNVAGAMVNMALCEAD